MDEPASPLDTGIELTATEYSHFVKLAGNDLKDAVGMGLHERLNDIIKNDESYKSANDVTRALTITKLVDAYRKAAAFKLLETEPGMMETYKTSQEKKTRGLSNKVDDSLNLGFDSISCHRPQS